MDRMASIRRIKDWISFKLSSWSLTCSTNSMTKRRFSLSTHHHPCRAELPSQSTLIILYSHDTTVDMFTRDSESAVSSCLIDSRYSYIINTSLPYCFVASIALQDQSLRCVKRLDRFVLRKTNNHNDKLNIQFYHFDVISLHIFIQNFLI